MEKMDSTLELIGGSPMCSGGTCPALYRDKSGKLYVQGSKITSEQKKQVAVGEHEEIVELTPELLAALKEYQQ